MPPASASASLHFQIWGGYVGDVKISIALPLSPSLPSCPPLQMRTEKKEKERNRMTFSKLVRIVILYLINFFFQFCSFYI